MEAGDQLAIATSVPRERAREALTRAGFEHRGDHPHSANFRHPNGEPVQLAFDPAFDAVIERAEPIGPPAEGEGAEDEGW